MRWRYQAEVVASGDRVWAVGEVDAASASRTLDSSSSTPPFQSCSLKAVRRLRRSRSRRLAAACSSIRRSSNASSSSSTRCSTFPSSRAVVSRSESSRRHSRARRRASASSSFSGEFSVHFRAELGELGVWPSEAAPTQLLGAPGTGTGSCSSGEGVTLSSTSGSAWLDSAVSSAVAELLDSFMPPTRRLLSSSAAMRAASWSSLPRLRVSRATARCSRSRARTSASCSNSR
mmetsp:Transcript_88382/g.162290  ORF Transcript_88382/g.162290 Transcript_88382/m.162290 type:complete len:232 (-) Transcript_88382:239-934(-)